MKLSLKKKNILFFFFYINAKYMIVGIIIKISAPQNIFLFECPTVFPLQRIFIVDEKIPSGFSTTPKATPEKKKV